MTDRQSKLVGYGLLSALSVILVVPIAEYMNANLPAGTIGDALGSFFWIIYPILIIWLIYNAVIALLQG